MLSGMMKKKRNVITNRTDEDFDDFEKVPISLSMNF
jgi:hypothetical protein